MKIIITSASYYPHLDGVQKVTQYQAEGLVKLGHQVTVITSDRMGEYKHFEMHNGVKIIRLNAYNKNMMHFGNKKEFQKVVLSLSDKADAMINVSLESFASDWILPIIDKVKCRKILMNHGMHDFNWNKQNISSGKEIVKKILRDIRWKIFYDSSWNKIKKYDSVIFLHEKDYAYKYFKNRNYQNKKVIYNAVDQEFFNELHVNKENNIINVGTFNERKNQLMCLETFYKADTKDFSLTLIGNPQNNYYRKLLEKKHELDNRYGRKKVDILVDLDRKETVEKIKASKIYLMTSTWEAFPISLIESMAAGSGFISSKVGIVSYLPGGIICNSEEDFINGIESMINGEWLLYGKKAKDYACINFQQDKQVKKLESILKEQ